MVAAGQDCQKHPALACLHCLGSRGLFVVLLHPAPKSKGLDSIRLLLERRGAGPPLERVGFSAQKSARLGWRTAAGDQAWRQLRVLLTKGG